MKVSKANEKKNFLLTRSLRKIFLRPTIIKKISSISPSLSLRFRHFLVKGYFPNLKKPITFDEKLIWLNLHWQHPLKTICADKYTMRSYVESNGLGHILTPLLGVYQDPHEIDFTKLPDRFVLKCTHGCGFNILCLNKKDLDINAVKQKLNKWIRTDISKIYGEIHYASMKPKIICEIFLNDLSAELPIDYKVFCFNGKAHCIMVCLGRNIVGHAKYYLYYDLDWKKIPYNKQSILENVDATKPSAFDEMIESAEILSKPFPHVRIDYYNIKDRAVLGEMTFTSQACIHPDHTELAQIIMGALLILPEKLG